MTDVDDWWDPFELGVGAPEDFDVPTTEINTDHGVEPGPERIIDVVVAE